MPSISGHGPAPRPAHRRRQADAIRGLKPFREISASHTGPQFRPARLPATRRQFRRTFLRHAELLPGTLPIQVHVRKNLRSKAQTPAVFPCRKCPLHTPGRSPQENRPSRRNTPGRTPTIPHTPPRPKTRAPLRRQSYPAHQLFRPCAVLSAVASPGLSGRKFRSRKPCREIPAPHAQVQALPCAARRRPTPQPPPSAAASSSGGIFFSSPDADPGRGLPAMQ